MAPQDLPKSSGIDLTPKASAPPITLPELTSEEVTQILQEEEDQRNALILEIEQEEEEQRMQIQEDEEEERAQALAISLLRRSEAGPSGSKQASHWALLNSLNALEEQIKIAKSMAELQGRVQSQP